MGLKNQIYKIEDVMAEELDISVGAARKVISESSFSDYLKIEEATTQGTQGFSSNIPPMDGDLGQEGSELPDWYDPQSQTGNSIDSTKFKPGDTMEIVDQDGNPVEVEFSKSLSNDTIQVKPNNNLQSPDLNIDELQLSDEQIQQMQDTEAQAMLSKLKMSQSQNQPQGEMEEAKKPPSKFDKPRSKKGGPNPYGRYAKNKSGWEPTGKIGKAVKKTGQTLFPKGALRQEDIEEQEELMRIQELAGIEETSSGGATGAGAIASGPNIIGDVAHRPTDHIRHKQKKKRNDKGRKRDGKKDNS